MGCSQSSEYYFGFINLNLSHLDVLSFVLGVVATVGTMYLVTCIRDSRKANKHILGRGKAKPYKGGCGPGGGPDWGSPPIYAPYSLPAAPVASPSMLSPDPATFPTAPYNSLQKPPVMVPWPSNAIQ